MFWIEIQRVLVFLLQNQLLEGHYRAPDQRPPGECHTRMFVYGCVALSLLWITSQPARKFNIVNDSDWSEMYNLRVEIMVKELAISCMTKDNYHALVVFMESVLCRQPSP